MKARWILSLLVTLAAARAEAPFLGMVASLRYGSPSRSDSVAFSALCTALYLGTTEDRDN